MLDLNDLLVVMKKAALEAMNASEPADIHFGKVISVSPLQIQVEQKMTLGAAQLVLTRNVTDYETEVTIDWKTEANDRMTGKKKITIHNDLKVGENVVLFQQKGGQKYIVLDRVVKA